jgi:hypothetical protein
MRLNWTSTATLCAATLLAVATSHAQQTQPPQQPRKNCIVHDENGKDVVWPDCKDPNAPPPTYTDPNAAPAAKQFPFPGEQPAANPAATTTPADPNVPAAKRFPFPGEQTPTDAAAPDSPLKDAGSSGSAPPPDSSSSSSSDPQGGSVGPLADDPDEDAAAKAAAERKAARHKLPPVPRQSPDERVAEDLQVASFYMDDKNYRGAYSRASDAVALAADDPNTQFALAEAARRLGKLDEAETHYKKCLTLDPIPKIKKSAEKALKEMSGGGSTSLMP